MSPGARHINFVTTLFIVLQTTLPSLFGLHFVEQDNGGGGKKSRWNAACGTIGRLRKRGHACGASGTVYVLKNCYSGTPWLRCGRRKKGVW